MAYDKEGNIFLKEQLKDAGNLQLKPLFGETGIYLEGVYIGAYCNHQLFFKITPEGEALLRSKVLGSMYEGAKPSFLIEEIDDAAYVCALAKATLEGLTKAKHTKRK